MKARALTNTEIESIRDYFANSVDHFQMRDLALFELCLNCGLRISEALALNIHHVVQNGQMVDRLELTATKGGKHRAIPLNNKAKESITAFLEWKEFIGESLDKDSPLYISRHGQRLVRSQAHNRLKAVFAACGLSGKATTHSLRKFFATQLHDRGAHIREIQELLGHSSVSTTQRYIDVTDAKLSAAVALLDG